MSKGGSLEYCGSLSNWDATLSRLGVTGSEHQQAEGAQEAPEKNEFRKITKTAKPVEKVDTVERQSGDWGVWKYYSQSIGWLPIFLALIFIVASTFTLGFPSRFHYVFWVAQLTLCRTVVTMEYRKIGSKPRHLCRSLFLGFDYQHPCSQRG